MDDWEGRRACDRRARHEGSVQLEHDRLADDVQVCLGTQARRRALVVAGRHLLCADVSYRDVDGLVGR
jgi:hypothetical protein